MREEICTARRADVHALDGVDAGVAEKAFGDGPEIEVASMQGGRTEPRAVGVGDLVAHLVAAGADARSDRGGEALTAERRDARLDDAVEEPLAAGVQHGERGAAVAARNRDRETVRGQLQ